MDKSEIYPAFNKEQFSNLLKLAQGKRTQNKFADDCNVSPAHLTRFHQLIKTVPPSPFILRKISENSEGKVLYMDLMITCGYLNLKDVSDLIYSIERL